MAPLPVTTAALVTRVSRRGPCCPISNSTTSGAFSGSPTQMNEPPASLTIDWYSRFARMHGGSTSSSLIALLLATITAPLRACANALRASAQTPASSPYSLQLS